MTFSLIPICAAVPPVAPESIPRYIQIQVNGVDLGGPDAHTINFVGFTAVVRGGSAVDDDTITVTA